MSRASRVTSRSKASTCVRNIYEQTKPVIQIYEEDCKEVQLDPELKKTGKCSKFSMYNHEFQNWKPTSHLVMGRPKEFIYDIKFRGQSHFA